MTNTKNRIADLSKKQDGSFNYRLLSRLQQDCEYYLGHGNRAKNQLWASDETEQIKKMKELYKGLPEKPEWISLEDIERYEAAMKPPSAETLPEIATRFNDSHRYINPNVAASLVLFLPVTDFRPEAMRVSMRTLLGDEWYEVETFSPTLNRWICQKSYADTQSATEDALGWYPNPEGAAHRILRSTDGNRQEAPC